MNKMMVNLVVKMRAFMKHVGLSGEISSVNRTSSHVSIRPTFLSPSDKFIMISIRNDRFGLLCVEAYGTEDCYTEKYLDPFDNSEFPIMNHHEEFKKNMVKGYTDSDENDLVEKILQDFKIVINRMIDEQVKENGFKLDPQPRITLENFHSELNIKPLTNELLREIESVELNEDKLDDNLKGGDEQQ